MGKDKIKPTHDKTRGERAMEIVKAFKKIANQFIDDGIPMTGKIPMEGYDRMLCYILTNHNLKESTIALMSTKK